MKAGSMVVMLAACAAVAACVPKTNVSVAADVPSQYTHAWLTINEVWFNTSDTATPTDTTWDKFTLSKPITIDLVSLTNGNLAEIAKNLELKAGTYRQIRLLPLDENTALTSVADDAGAQFNSEADFIDSSGKTRKVPLELLNPEKGIGVQTSFKLKSNGSVQSRPDDTSLVFALGMSDLVQFNDGSKTGVLLNPHAAAYDTAAAGTISGTIDLADLATSINSSGQVNVFVTAEGISSDGTRHTAVKTASVAADGSFVLYPLPTDATTSTNYDLVVHGPDISTVIIKTVPVSVGDPASTGVISVGTITPRAAAPFTMNLKDEEQEFPPGSLLGFYQTIPQPGELPYLIDQVALDPFSRTLFADHPLSQQTIDFGVYVQDATVTLTNVTPVQGAGAYTIVAQATRFTDGALTATVAAPSSGTDPVLVTLPSPKPSSGSDASSLSLRVVALTPGKYDRGQLIISRDGAIIQTLTLDSALTKSGGDTLTLNNLPAGDEDDFYYALTRAWNSDDPDGTMHRQSVIIPLDLRAGGITTTGIPLVVN